MRLIKLMVCLVVCLSLSVVAFAHSGKTDAYGGHVDHSTGEYHYHHGYPAHQHRDMDENGTLDCPYLFKDKTESSSNKTETPSNKTEPTTGKSETQKETKKRKTAEYYVTVFFGLYFVLFLILFVACWAEEVVKRFRKK